MCDITPFYACKSPDQTSGHTLMACQPSDCILPLLKSSSSVCVGMYRFTLEGGWLVVCCLMTPGLSKDIRCHV